MTDLPAAAANCLPSGLTASALDAGGMTRERLERAGTGQSQILAVLSWLPERMCLPSGAMATARTSLECPSYFLISLRVAASQSRTVLSKPAVAKVLPSGLQAIA